MEKSIKEFKAERARDRRAAQNIAEGYPEGKRPRGRPSSRRGLKSGSKVRDDTLNIRLLHLLPPGEHNPPYSDSEYREIPAGFR